jgi:ABC-2 type transport system ATP-binding protein
VASTTASPAIVVENLVKSYGKVRALDDLSLVVPEGTVLGVLGPNGAGKTTCVRVLTTLVSPDSGRATVAGVDVVADPARVRTVIGLSGQYAAVDEYLTGYENLHMVARLYRLGRKASSVRARELLERFRLTEAADRPVKTYSGGMRRRLDLAGALVAEPAVLFLDEPTTGLDPRSRSDMWSVITELVAGGTSLFLTTQYMEEAERLADQIVVIDRGKVIAGGTADELKATIGGERLELTVPQLAQVGEAQRILAAFDGGEVSVDGQTGRITMPLAGGGAAMVEPLRRLGEAGVVVHDVGMRRPTLDDVFLTLTGHSADNAESDAQTDSKELAR